MFANGGIVESPPLVYNVCIIVSLSIVMLVNRPFYGIGCGGYGCIVNRGSDKYAISLKSPKRTLVNRIAIVVKFYIIDMATFIRP